jgi:hypothetical protein
MTDNEDEQTAAAKLAARDHEVMMIEARKAFAHLPLERRENLLALASIIAKRIVTNPDAQIGWEEFLELNK